jgi:hypothetical protein
VPYLWAWGFKSPLRHQLTRANALVIVVFTSERSLVLDGVRRPRAGLASAVVVGAFGPGDDLDAEVVAGCPAVASVEDVVLEEGEERFHGGVVAGGTDLAHGADQPVAGQGPVDLPGAVLAGFNRSEWTMQPATSPRQPGVIS